ncbi:MAG TPA: ATP-dependent RNA helicase HrpA [Porticoccaceae bacterium]|nr:ATP-dependent RNA helicase HrpA [Porticoccaceae bacterium]
MTRPAFAATIIQDIESLSALLPTCMGRDRHRFRRDINRLSKLVEAHGYSNGRADGASLEPSNVDNDLTKLRARMERSRQLADVRRASLPAVSYPEQLPISARRDEILRLLREHQVIIVAGETGSGKTTQLPKICLEAGRGVSGLIAHTQPRRIAARTVASRIAEELNVSLGETVGYQVRFKDHSTDESLVKLMTDGILLAEIQRDRFLNRYDTIIIDEAHERSLNIDFLLGYLKQLLPRRRDLKLVITSATIDVERFSAHFDNAPVIEVSGRTYPVEYRYRPVLDDEDRNEAIAGAVEELLALPQRGDILVFLSGEREIRQAAQHLRRRQFPHLEILPLYARLNLAEQNRVFQPHRGTRVVLATNVAETSLTVPGIRYVIDTGLARISRYSYRTKVQQLPIEPVSQASANQRAGRCGRLSDGVCIRLFSEEDFQQRPAFTTPEILRTNLAAVILQMLRLKIGDVRRFPFMEPPDRRLINDGFTLLKELRAVDPRERLNAEGRRLANFSVDPRLGKMLLAAEQEGCVREMLIIVAALSIQDPRERPSDKREQADQQHRQWRDDDSDFLSIMKLWRHFEDQRLELSRNQFAKYCRQSFVSYLRMVEWRDLHHQLHLDVKHAGLKINKPLELDKEAYACIHRALLTGLLAHIGFRHEAREYLGVRNRRFFIFPGSGLAAKPPKWVVSAELIETSRLYAHFNARINPEWLPPLAEHLSRKHYSEPHYDWRRGQIMAYEKQTLYGLTISEGKKINYGPVDAEVAREIFIQSALVEGAYLKTLQHQRGRGRRSSGSVSVENNLFAKHNAALLADLQGLEERLRRRDIVADETVLFEFYDQRLPRDVLNFAGFERWRKQAEAKQPRLLFVERALLVKQAPSEEEEAQFPRSLEWGGIEYQLSYRFDPGHREDGLNVDVPLDILHQAPRYRFEWLVPGLLRDKCIALIKKLPKQWRKHFVPVPEYVDRVLPRLKPDNRLLHEVLGEQLAYVSGVDVPLNCWQPEALEDLYRANFRLLDERGKVLASSRDLDVLRDEYREAVQESIDKNADDAFIQVGLTRWEFGDLPEVRVIEKNRHKIRVYPALRDDGDSVALILCDQPELAGNQSLAGVIRLAMLANRQTLKYLHKTLFKNKDLLLSAANLPDKQALQADLIRLAFHEACFAGQPLPRDQETFESQVNRGKGTVVETALSLEVHLFEALELVAQVRALMRKKLGHFPEVRERIEAQLQGLFAPDFCFFAGENWLKQYPRYLRALLQRLDKPLQKSARELEFLAQLAIFEETLIRCQTQCEKLTAEVREQIRTFRFMLEEYRVSHYAQQLKTIAPVSTKRLLVMQQAIEEAMA